MTTISALDKYIKIEDIFHIFRTEKNAVFLDSSLHNEVGNFSIIGINPYLELQVRGNSFFVCYNGADSDKSYVVHEGDSKYAFEDFMKKYLKDNHEENDTRFPIISGAIGYFGYDFGRRYEKIPDTAQKDIDIPDCLWNFYDNFIIEDIENRKIYITASGKLCPVKEPIELIKQKINNMDLFEFNIDEEKEIKVTSNFEKDNYMRAIEQVRKYIEDGDIYIMNMTQRLTVESEKPPYDCFRKLRKINPSPFGAYMNYEDFSIICSSMERFMKKKGSHIETKPIKGTRKRGNTFEEDWAMKEELANSQKDMSELLMIVDLERNDLNRICVPGTVKVPDLFTIEEYATVFHLVSTVTGESREEKDVIDLISASFPGGSITGAPKIRAMEIIEELEPQRRSIYTGSIGYIGLDGNCDLNIVIRTMLHYNDLYYIGVGGGITYESEQEFEHEETLIKAKALLDALK